VDKRPGLTKIAFPSISTGAYRFPIDLAARVALGTIVEFLEKETFGEVTMALFSDNDYKVYETTLKEIMAKE